ncbi:unnamed protein product (macronuclear) [Paramecium tetraurelia]|uniref:Transmembrane protein n=1 Tax=Paramecium tetraurelia TaxID=5888 RepID=A0BAP4_PARTE|nr:uncharacterized protein GSPATT00000046001 [Paramecium tetraurelia]CAK55611.1 unnamed protein product [Paramecium tetraurelia]|eukprot:XP_001423009.1 hypothetical protein (macronuclear) [Paramecium tetraurelia strain d4-2]
MFLSNKRKQELFRLDSMLDKLNEFIQNQSLQLEKIQRIKTLESIDQQKQFQFKIKPLEITILFEKLNTLLLKRKSSILIHMLIVTKYQTASKVKYNTQESINIKCFTPRDINQQSLNSISGGGNKQKMSSHFSRLQQSYNKENIGSTRSSHQNSQLRSNCIYYQIDTIKENNKVKKKDFLLSPTETPLLNQKTTKYNFLKNKIYTPSYNRQLKSSYKSYQSQSRERVFSKNFRKGLLQFDDNTLNNYQITQTIISNQQNQISYFTIETNTTEEEDQQDQLFTNPSEWNQYLISRDNKFVQSRQQTSVNTQTQQLQRETTNILKSCLFGFFLGLFLGLMLLQNLYIFM